jgi:ABC-2 type transport system permease protein
VIRLLGVELNRFRSRRAIVLLSLAALVVAVVLVGATAWKTRPLSAADRTDATAQADLEGQRPEIQQQVRACRAQPGDFLGPGATPDQCEEALVPGPDAYYPREPLSLRSALSQSGFGVPLALVVIGLMVIAGSTFIGADWSTRSLTNQLIFEPRRTRVWLAKAAAVTLGCGVVALVVLSGFWLGIGALAQARDIAMPSSQMTDVVWHVVRAVALVMGAGLGAFALTAVFRHTVATLAVLFVYSVGGEIAVNVLPFEGAGRWSVGNNALGWLATLHRYFDATIVCGPGERCSAMQVMTHLEAGTFLGILLLVAVVVSLLWFRRSDV